jgi:hypothetical protein
VYFVLVAGINPANLKMLEAINTFFGNIGTITKGSNNNCYYLRIVGLANCLIVKNHFDLYPLLSYKLVYYQIWCVVLDMMCSKKHLNLEGLNEIIALKFHCSKGLSTLLLNSFPNFIPISCLPYLPNFSLINIDWICGFINADGSFLLTIKQGKTHDSFLHSIRITQNNVSLSLLQHIISFLGFGNIYTRKLGDASDIVVSNLNSINIFISKLNQCEFLGAKALDYKDFCRAIDLFNNKSHLTAAGFKALKQIKAGMNNGRTNFN